MVMSRMLTSASRAGLAWFHAIVGSIEAAFCGSNPSNVAPSVW